MKKKVLALFVLLFLLVPVSVLADNATVIFRKGFMYDAEQLATVQAVKNVTTLGQLKQMWQDNYHVNLNNYRIVDNGYNEIADDTVLCQGNIQCYGDTVYLNVFLVDNTEVNINVDSIPPIDEQMFTSLLQVNYEKFHEMGLTYKNNSCNSSFTKCTFYDGQNRLTFYPNVSLSYNYNNNIKSLVDQIVGNGLLNKISFTLTDTEFLNYLNYGGVLADYSSEFKNQLSNFNFKFEMDPAGGGFDPFQTDEIGFYKFSYGGTLYAVKEYMEISAKHIIYVPSDTTDIKKAIENRLKDLFGSDNHIVVAESDDTINDLLGETVENGNQHYYILTSMNEDIDIYGMEFDFIAIKDSSKINNDIVFYSNDLVTNVLVSTDYDIPRDTMIKVLELTNGEKYDQIMKILNITDGEMFDISLYSSAQNKNITKLDNGKFLVGIPIPDKFKGKKLTIYYVDENDEIIEYEVDDTYKEGYAYFETDHFSIYTLAEKTNGSNPKTGDNINSYLILFRISLMGLVTVLIGKKLKLSFQ